jgi:hypothetical protein
MVGSGDGGSDLSHLGSEINRTLQDSVVSSNAEKVKAGPSGRAAS